MGQLNSQASWTDADADRLKNARESAGSDLHTVARNNSLSSAQLLELEQGGDSYFYSASIKYNVGKKLLNSFDAQTEFDILSEETKTQSHKDTEVVETFLEEAAQHLQPEQYVTGLNTAKPLLYLVAMLAICIAIAFVIYPIFTNLTNTEKTITSTQISQVEKFAEPEISTPPSKPDTLQNNQAEATKIESQTNECVWSENLTNLTAQNATKDGNYVYLVAMKALVVCIKDQTNKVNIVNLKQNEPQNISVVAPLTLQSRDLDSLNIFFQGSKIQLPTQGITEIKLVAKPLQ
jgi:transcriptional regulator with XRE-family HTH domain